MKFKNPRELQAAYPYMFGGPQLGLSVARGWFPVFAQLCVEIDTMLGEDKNGFHWKQLKEKFGAARWYWTIKSPPRALSTDVVEQISKLIENTQSATKHLCIACGDPGKPHDSDGYFLVVCPEHAAKRERNAYRFNDSAWYSSDEDFHIQLAADEYNRKEPKQ